MSRGPLEPGERVRSEGDFSFQVYQYNNGIQTSKVAELDT